VRRIVSIVAVLAVAALVATPPLAAGLSSPNSQSANIDIAFRDTSDNVKFVDNTGNVVDTGADGDSVGGVADIDGDGDLDIIFADANADLKYVDDNGNIVDTGANANHVGGVGDIDGDGDLDIAYRSDVDQLKYVDGNGNIVDTGANAFGGVGGVGDIDGDGDSDIAFKDFDDNLEYIDDDGNKVTTGQDTTDVGGVADIDGDGDLDIAYRDTGGNIKYVDDSGNVVNTGVDGLDVGGVADIDGDGDLDIAYRDTGGNIKYVDDSGNVVDTGVDGSDVGGVADIDGDGFFTAPASLDNTSANPDGTTVTTGSVSLSIPVSDPELDDGDSVTVDVTLNGQQVGSKTITSNKTVSVSATPQDGTNSWSATATDSSGNKATSQTFSFTGDLAAPRGSDPSPTGQITSYGGDISLNVSDADFALAAGDSVTVEATNATGQIGKTTVSSNQTVSLSYAAKAGPNDITWTLNDTYGQTTTVNQQFSTPAEVRVFNASDPDSLITGTQNEITVSFFGQTDAVFSRTTTTGRVNLSGLPAAPDRGYQIDVEDGANYQSRSVVIDSLFEQQSVYLLPTNATTTTVEFRLTDRTGRFQQPRLNVRKPITKDFNGDGNKSTQFRTVVSDEFSAAQSLTLTLERGTRHRLEIVNENGATRTLGSYTPSTATDVQQLTIAQVSLAPEPAQTGVGLDASLTEASGQRVVRLVFDDPRNQSTNIDLTVTRTDLNSNQTVAQQSIAGPIGRQVSTFVVNATADAPAYNVEISYDRGGQTRQASIQLGNVGEWRLAYLNDQVASLTAWVITIAITGLVVIRTPRIAAVVAVVLTTLFSTLGIISVGPVPLGIAGATAVLFVVSRGVGQ
jgi:hypothetical protein